MRQLVSYLIMPGSLSKRNDHDRLFLVKKQKLKVSVWKVTVITVDLIFWHQFAMLMSPAFNERYFLYKQ